MKNIKQLLTVLGKIHFLMLATLMLVLGNNAYAQQPGSSHGMPDKKIDPSQASNGRK